MRKFILFIAVFIILAAGGFYFFPTSKKTVLVVGVECDYMPYNWEEKTSTEDNFPLVDSKFYVEGYDVQIANLVAEKMGMKAVFKKVNRP